MTIEQTVEIPASPLTDGTRNIERVDEQMPPAPVREDIGMDGECRLDHTPNAETAAAIREGRAMMRGEIPANRYHTIEEMLTELKR